MKEFDKYLLKEWKEIGLKQITKEIKNCMILFRHNIKQPLRSREF